MSICVPKGIQSCRSNRVPFSAVPFFLILYLVVLDVGSTNAVRIKCSIKLIFQNLAWHLNSEYSGHMTESTTASRSMEQRVFSFIFCWYCLFQINWHPGHLRRKDLGLTQRHASHLTVPIAYGVNQCIWTAILWMEWVGTNPQERLPLVTW